MSCWASRAELRGGVKGPCPPSPILCGQAGSWRGFLLFQSAWWSRAGVVALVALVLRLQNRLFCSRLLTIGRGDPRWRVSSCPVLLSSSAACSGARPPVARVDVVSPSQPQA